MQEINVIGPPGCGKTTWLSHQVERAVDKYGADGVMVCSFTKAAVAELNRRELPIPDRQVGTLHALAYRALNMPKIAEQGKYLKQFSEEYPAYALDDGTREDVDDGYSHQGRDGGSKFLSEYARLRALMRPRESWPESVLDFSQKWEKFKDDTFTRDFTDLIEDCLKEDVGSGIDAAVGMFDEAQDLAPLQLSLIRRWGRNMEKVVLVGDADQALYEWAGAKADLGMNPAAHLITLKQSYRVSQAVHEFSEKIIRQIPDSERVQREYLPTTEIGEVIPLSGTLKHPERWFDVIQNHLDDYRTVMILTSCSYMLNPLVEFLRREAIPFANPYRRKRRDWNPLTVSKRQTTANARVIAYMAGWRRDPVTWTGEELSLWLPLSAGILKRGSRDKLVQVTGLAPADLIGEAMPLESMLAAGPEWLLEHLSTSHRRADYQVMIGARAWENLETEPALMVGTYHSVKGGEADVVVAFPDISPQAAKAWRYGEIGPTVRMFFVGTTRARTSLYLGEATNSGFTIRWPA